MFDPGLLLSSDSARSIFSEIEGLPVLDIHTHVNLPEVLANQPAQDPWTALCHHDHYVSSIIESLGGMSRQRLFSPETDPFDKWQAYASVFPDLPGNQIRDWMKMTLQSLGIRMQFNAENARPIWDQLSETLAQERWRPVNLFKESQIRLMATTNSPLDSLEEHRQAAEVFGDGYWIPTWRPDPFFNLLPGPIRVNSWKRWVELLGERVDRDLIGDFKAFKEALSGRHSFFASMGCHASDYGVNVPYGHTVSDKRARSVFEAACKQKEIEPRDAADFQSYMLRFSMSLDYERGWISQIHYGAARNQRQLAGKLGGLDSGCDTIMGYPQLVHSLHDLLNHFDRAEGRQHKIFIYSLSKADWEKIAGLSRIFSSVYAGMSWWYFDSVSGMLEFFRTMPDMGAGFRKIGPFVTDARNIYSLEPRTQIYRRCLATVLGECVDLRKDSMEEATSLARRLCTDEIQRLLYGAGR